MSTTGKFIRADDPTHEALQQLAKEHKLSNTKLLAAMVEYFRVTKADPQQPTAPDLTTSLAKITAKVADLEKRTIGFIREQEKNYLKPILAQVQAQQVLSTPAVSAPAMLSESQAKELGNWLLRLIRRTMQPALLTERFLAGRLADPPAPGQADPGLLIVKQHLASAFDLSFRPEMMIPQKPAPTVAPVSPSAKPA